MTTSTPTVPVNNNNNNVLTTSIEVDLALSQPVLGLSPVSSYIFDVKSPVKVLPNLSYVQYKEMFDQQINLISTFLADNNDTKNPKVSQIKSTYVPGYSPDDLTIDMKLLKSFYFANGIRTTVEACILVHDHGHPHILVLQSPSGHYRLPGASLDPEEDEISGLQKRLQALLKPIPSSVEENNNINLDDIWHIGPLLSVWWRPNFEGYLYPYIPTHINQPKEMKKTFLVQVPSLNDVNENNNSLPTLTVPSNYKLLAIPLFDLYDNVQTYGQIISSIPLNLSRFYFQYL